MLASLKLSLGSEWHRHTRKKYLWVLPNGNRTNNLAVSTSNALLLSYSRLVKIIKRLNDILTSLLYFFSCYLHIYVCLPFLVRRSWSDLPERASKLFELSRRSPQSLHLTLCIFASNVSHFRGTFSMLCATFHILRETFQDSYLPWVPREPINVKDKKLITFFSCIVELATLKLRLRDKKNRVFLSIQTSWKSLSRASKAFSSMAGFSLRSWDFLSVWNSIHR